MGFVCIRRSSVKIVPAERLGAVPSDERPCAPFLAFLTRGFWSCVRKETKQSSDLAVGTPEL